MLGDAATAEICAAWGEAYWFLAELLIGREATIYRNLAAKPGGWNGWREFVVESVGDVGIVFRQDVEGDVLLGDPLDGAGERAQIVDVARIGQHGLGQSLGLRASLTVVRLVEEIADLRVPEQALVHAPRDLQSMRLQRRNGGLDAGDGGRCQRRRHGRLPKGAFDTKLLR